MDSDIKIRPEITFCDEDHRVPYDFPPHMLVVVPNLPNTVGAQKFKEEYVGEIICIKAGENIYERPRRAIAVFRKPATEAQYEFDDAVFALKTPKVMFFHQPHPWPEVARVLDDSGKGLAALITPGKNDKPFAAISSAIRGEKDFKKELDFGFLTPATALISSVHWNHWNRQGLDGLHRLDAITRCGGIDISNLPAEVQQNRARYLLRKLREKTGLHTGTDNDVSLPLAGLYACIAMAKALNAKTARTQTPNNC